MLYRSTDRLCRCGAPVQYLPHSASFHSLEKYAPPNAGTKHLIQENIFSGPSGYALDNTVQQVNAIALDGSGNIWLGTSGNLTELVGAAARVVTPAVTAAVN